MVAVIGTPAPEDAVAAFRDGALIVVGGGVLTSLAALAMGRVGRADSVPSRAWPSPASAPPAASSSTAAVS